MGSDIDAARIAVRESIDRWIDAVRARDLDAMMNAYADDLVGFDVMPPARHEGRDAWRRVWAGFFENTEGPIDFETSEMRIEAGADLAWCHLLNRVGCTGKDGTRHEALVRATICFRNSGGRWLVAHEHASIPMPMPSPGACESAAQ